MSNLNGFVMSDERWNKLVGSVRFALEQGQYKGSNIQDNEIDLIVSVLKNNIPFDVVGENYVSH